MCVWFDHLDTVTGPQRRGRVNKKGMILGKCHLQWCRRLFTAWPAPALRKQGDLPCLWTWGWWGRLPHCWAQTQGGPDTTDCLLLFSPRHLFRRSHPLLPPASSLLHNEDVKTSALLLTPFLNLLTTWSRVPNVLPRCPGIEGGGDNCIRARCAQVSCTPSVVLDINPLKP